MLFLSRYFFLHVYFPAYIHYFSIPFKALYILGMNAGEGVGNNQLPLFLKEWTLPSCWFCTPSWPKWSLISPLSTMFGLVSGLFISFHCSESHLWTHMMLSIQQNLICCKPIPLNFFIFRSIWPFSVLCYSIYSKYLLMFNINCLSICSYLTWTVGNGTETVVSGNSHVLRAFNSLTYEQGELFICPSSAAVSLSFRF